MKAKRSGPGADEGIKKKKRVDKNVSVPYTLLRLTINIST
jgi:hypothetical protein